MDTANAKPEPDWEKIEVDYRAGVKTLRQRAEERFLHAKFSTHRVRGEWFRLADHDLSMIAERAKLI